MPRVRFHDADDHVVGAIDIPTTAGRITVACVGRDREHALARAASVADRVVTDPLIAAIVPERVHAAREVGFLPLIIAAASAAQKYGPVAMKAYKAYKARKQLAAQALAAGDQAAAAAIDAQAKALAEKIRTAAAEAPAAVSEVGWNPFKKKRKKRKAQPRSSRSSRERNEDQENDEGEDNDEGAEE